MSKEHVSARVPQNLREKVETVSEEQDIDKSDVICQALDRGLDTYDRSDADRGAGEVLARNATSVGAVGTVVAVIGMALGQPTLGSLAIPASLSTFVFALLWASIRALAGRELV